LKKSSGVVAGRPNATSSTGATLRSMTDGPSVLKKIFIWDCRKQLVPEAFAALGRKASKETGAIVCIWPEDF